MSALTITMKMNIAIRNSGLKILTPAIAGLALGLLPGNAHAQTTLFSATFPASWSGTGTSVTDQGGTATGNLSGTGYSYDTTDVPPGATAGTGSLALSSGTGGIKVTPDESLANATVAADGGFTYNIDFMWNGTDSSSYSGVEKLIDYAGTESLQLVTTSTSAATLEMEFGDDSANQTTAVSTTIAANTWYNVTMTFNTAGNSLVGNDISGIATLYVNGANDGSASATKGDGGDNLDRPIGIGEFGYGVSTSIIGLYGDIYSASVDLGVAPVPEPSTFALSALGGLGMMGMMWKARRRKA